jgi:tetratricopeptide (TPR) repeat protein
MAPQRGKPNSSTRQSELSVPLLLLLAFALGAGTTWLLMRNSSSERPPAIETFLPAGAAQTSASSEPPASISTQPPDVSQLSPADAERTLGNWNYDRQAWQHAIDHYQKAISSGADNPDVRTDMGNCYRFLGQPEQALEQYKIAQNQNPQHENSLFNQISLYGQLLNNREKATEVAREFLARFPNSPRVEAVRKEVAGLAPATLPK